MNGEKNPFEKKDPNKEIENILNEIPLEDPKAKPQKQIRVPGTKPRFSKKKIIIEMGFIIMALILSFMLLYSLQDKCEPCNCETETTNIMSNEDFVNLIKQQIIDKGYAEISTEAFTMKVSPYIE